MIAYEQTLGAHAAVAAHLHMSTEDIAPGHHPDQRKAIDHEAVCKPSAVPCPGVEGRRIKEII